MAEKVVETKTCRHCKASFDITDKDLEFYEKVSPIFSSPSPSDIPLDWGGIKGGVLNLWGGKIKYLIPTPTLCPNCRKQRRLTWQNMYSLYKRTCSLTWKNIISVFSPDKKYIVYNQEDWWSDKWDPLDYWKDFDFSRSFFEQFYEMDKHIPQVWLLSNYLMDENSPYTNYSGWSKNCYLIFHADFNENCAYGTGIKKCKTCYDNLMIFESELLYECINCKKCYNIKFSKDCENCSNSSFLTSCRACQHCFWCIWLQNKQYHIYNKQVSEKEYKDFISNFSFTNQKNISEAYKEIENLKIKTPRKNFEGYQNENCSGDHIFYSENVIDSFDIQEARNSKFCERIYIWPNSDSYDIDQFWNVMSLCYECSCAGWNASKILFSNFVDEGWYNILYSSVCLWCKNLFGCIWLRNKEYCIFNKQHTKEEYEKLVPKIIEYMQKMGEWWEFFPSSISPFGYNETVANEYFPLARDVALQHLSEDWKQLFNWSDYEAPFPKVEKIIPANKLPENIKEIPDDILNWAIECEITKKPFRIIKQELEFYRKYNLPIPKRHPDQRHLDRMKLRNPRKLYKRKCDKCGKEIQSTYAPERSEIVYCEGCYEKEIII